MKFDELQSALETVVATHYPNARVPLFFFPHTDPAKGDVWSDVAFRLSDAEKLPLDLVERTLSSGIALPEGARAACERGYLNFWIEGAPDILFLDQWQGSEISIHPPPFSEELTGEGYVRAMARPLLQTLLAIASGRRVQWHGWGEDGSCRSEIVEAYQSDWVWGAWSTVLSQGRGEVSARVSRACWSKGLRDRMFDECTSMTTLWLIPAFLDFGVVTELKNLSMRRPMVCLGRLSHRNLAGWREDMVPAEPRDWNRNLLFLLASDVPVSDLDIGSAGRNEQGNFCWYFETTRARIGQWHAVTQGAKESPSQSAHCVLSRRWEWLRLHLHRALMCGDIDIFLSTCGEAMTLLHHEVNNPRVRQEWAAGRIQSTHRRILTLAHDFLFDRMWACVLSS